MFIAFLQTEPVQGGKKLKNKRLLLISSKREEKNSDHRKKSECFRNKYSETKHKPQQRKLKLKDPEKEIRSLAPVYELPGPSDIYHERGNR